MEDQLNILSLWEQVYAYLRKQMTLGSLIIGTTINIGGDIPSRYEHTVRYYGYFSNKSRVK